MISKQINALYFSATGTTKKIVTGIADKISENIVGKIEINKIDFTLPDARKQSVSFAKEHIVVVGVPVYGRKEIGRAWPSESRLMSLGINGELKV